MHTPIINIYMQGNPSPLATFHWQKEFEAHFMKVGLKNLVKLVKARLGAPKRFQSFVRNHVWETKFWTMYISSEGISLEVEETLTPDQAHYVWKDWFNTMCEAVGEPERKI